jgi:hypothetical protein
MITKKVVIEKKCDRCPRVFEKCDVDENAPDIESPNDLVIDFLGEEIIYADLCKVCADKIKRLIGEMRTVDYKKRKQSEKESVTDDGKNGGMVTEPSDVEPEIAQEV